MSQEERRSFHYYIPRSVAKTLDLVPLFGLEEQDRSYQHHTLTILLGCPKIPSLPTLQMLQPLDVKQLISRSTALRVLRRIDLPSGWGISFRPELSLPGFLSAFKPIEATAILPCVPVWRLAQRLIPQGGTPVTQHPVPRIHYPRYQGSPLCVGESIALLFPET